MVQERADANTIPGFTMQSENFYLKFITGLQCGVSSKLMEYETDWYEVMEILLSRLQDEPENKELFENIASRDLEYWARMQEGGDSLNLEIRVTLEEKRYLEPPAGSRKALRLVFNDRFSTQVLFHVRKKMFLRSLMQISAEAVADMVNDEDTLNNLDAELPHTLIPEVKRAYHNCWTPRFFRTKLVRHPCPPSCSCKNKIFTSYVAQLASSNNSPPQQPEQQQPSQPQHQPEVVVLDDPVDPLHVEEPEQQPQPQDIHHHPDPQPSTSSSSSASSSPSSSRRPVPKKKTVKRTSRRLRSQQRKAQRDTTKECDKCKDNTKITTRSNCDSKKSKESSQSKVKSKSSTSSSASPGYLKGLKVRIKQLSLKFEFDSLVMKVRGNKRKAEEKVESPRRKSSRLVSLKESLLKKSKKSGLTKEDIFEPRPLRSSTRKVKLSVHNKSIKKASTTSHRQSDIISFKRTLRSHVLEASSARKRRRHS